MLLERYLEQHYASSDSEEQAAFRALLDLEDPLLYRRLIGQDPADGDLQRSVIDTMQRLARKEKP